ncbi:hypothetical protein ACSYOZ_004302, partial [Escherichia coli]
LLNFAFVIFAFLRRYGRRIIREIFPSATPQKSFFCVFISSAEIISKTFNLASKSPPPQVDSGAYVTRKNFTA